MSNLEMEIRIGIAQFPLGVVVFVKDTALFLGTVGPSIPPGLVNSALLGFVMPSTPPGLVNLTTR
jgi:hypothetical protein